MAEGIQIADLSFMVLSLTCSGSFKTFLVFHGIPYLFFSASLPCLLTIKDRDNLSSAEIFSQIKLQIVHEVVIFMFVVMLNYLTHKRVISNHILQKDKQE